MKTWLPLLLAMVAAAVSGCGFRSCCSVAEPVPFLAGMEEADSIKEVFSPVFRSDTLSPAMREAIGPLPKGSPVRFGDLRVLTLSHYGFDGKPHLGQMVCNKAVADDLLEIFERLFDLRYQIRSIRPVSDFGGSDTASMEADNTSCFNCRRVDGMSRWSSHAMGMAVDINPLENPWVRGSRVKPQSALQYADRTRDFPHKLTTEDPAVRLFRSKGFVWGGSWRSVKDWQHFEKPLQDSKQAAPGE